MTTQEIKARLEQINSVLHSTRALADDERTASALERDLFETFIRHVASKPCRLGRKAALVLKSKDIKFKRWSS